MKCDHSKTQKRMFMEKLAVLCVPCVKELIAEGKYEHWKDLE